MPHSTLEQPRSRSLALPSATSALYAARLAGDGSDLELAQSLRFEVFNLEMGEGLEASFRTGLDSDPFDLCCDHLLVFHLPTGELAGTYRLQTGMAAAAGRGYYSEQEFDFGPFEPFRPEIVELGRACVHRSHRNLSVLGLLWKGIATYAQERKSRYLIGCSSLPTLDPAAAGSAYARLRSRHLAPPEWQTFPRPGWECRLGVSPDAYPVPKLMQAYFSMGAEICGPPALDREFGTIDFLTWLDLDRLHPAARQRFFT